MELVLCTHRWSSEKTLHSVSVKASFLFSSIVLQGCGLCSVIKAMILENFLIN
jgi:hypothetical protein